MLRRLSATALLATALVGGTAAGQQLGGVHVLGLGELPSAPPKQVSSPPPPPPKPVAAPRAVAPFTLRRVVLAGRSSVPETELATAWAGQVGTSVSDAELKAIAQRLSAMEAQADIALYEVGFPRIDRSHGVVTISITEASVTRVVIDQRTKGARLGLLKAYANPILASRPLKRSVLERQILLMGDMAGNKVGSSFAAVPRHPDQVALVLAVSEQKIFGGFNVNNQGTPLLDQTQLVGNVGVNNLFHEGERTQLVIGLPIDITRYHYFGINDIEPLGPSGMTLSLNAAQLVSNAAGTIDGNAQLYGAHLNYPVIRSVHTNLNASLGLDAINSANAYLGYTLSDERTRAVRAGLSYADDKYFQGIDNAAFTVSQGVGILGARGAGPAYGRPEFLKGNVSLQRLQVLPKGFALRLSFLGQIADDRLPPSEEFDYGGPDYGLAFLAGTLAGDEGVTGLAQLAHPLPQAWLPNFLAGSSVFMLADYGQVWNRNTIYVQPTDRGASFAAGVKIRLAGKVDVTLGAATPIVTPRYAGPQQRWRFIFNTTGTF